MKITPNLDKKREEIATQIRVKYAQLMEQIVKPYSATERETWFSQLKEADEWLANNNTPTPLLSALATNRGISLDLLVTKVKENDQLYRTTIGTLLGQQQKELDTLYANTMN